MATALKGSCGSAPPPSVGPLEFSEQVEAVSSATSLMQFGNSFLWCGSVHGPAGGLISPGYAAAMRIVLGLQGCLGRWFVSSGIRINARTQGSPAVHGAAVRYPMLFALFVSDF